MSIRFLMILVISGMIGCKQQDETPPLSGKRAAPFNLVVNRGFIGTWMLVLSSSQTSSPVDYRDNLETIESQGYGLFIVNSDFRLTQETQGFMDRNGNLQTEQAIYTGNSLSPKDERSAALVYGQETTEKAKRDGASDQEISKINSNPCLLHLKTPTTATMTCQNNVSELVKIDDDTTKNLRSKTVDDIQKITAFTANLASLLGGTNWTLTEVKYRNVDPNGGIYEFSQLSSSIKEEETYTDQSKVTTSNYNAKQLSFSSDLLSGQINNNKNILVKVRALKNSKDLSIRLAYKVDDHRFNYLPQGGLVQISKDKTSLALMTDTSISETRYQTWYIYKRSN